MHHVNDYVKCIMSRLWMSNVTHMRTSCHTWEWVMSHIEWVINAICHRIEFMHHVTPMNEWWHVWMSHGTYEWVMAHISTSYVTYEWVMALVSISHATYEWVMTYMNESWQIWLGHVTHIDESCHTYEWFVSHIWINRVTHMNDSCHTYELVMSHIWMSLVTHMNESCHTYESVMSHIWMIHGTPRMSYVTHKNESCYTCERAMSHIWMSHMAHMKESCHKYEWVSNALCYKYSDIILRTWICHVAWHIPSSSTARLQYVHRVTHMNELCHANECVVPHDARGIMSHTWISHVTHMIASYHMTHSHSATSLP